MAAKSPKPEIQALIARSHAARQQLGSAAADLRAKLDAPARVRESMRSHPTRWLAGATATGLIATRLLLRRPRAKSAKKPRSILFFLIKIATNAAMPAMKIWLLAQIKAYLSRRVSDTRPPRSL